MNKLTLLLLLLLASALSAFSQTEESLIKEPWLQETPDLVTPDATTRIIVTDGTPATVLGAKGHSVGIADLISADVDNDIIVGVDGRLFNSLSSRTRPFQVIGTAESASNDDNVPGTANVYRTGDVLLGGLDSAPTRTDGDPQLEVVGSFASGANNHRIIDNRNQAAIAGSNNIISGFNAVIAGGSDNIVVNSASFSGASVGGNIGGGGVRQSQISTNLGVLTNSSNSAQVATDRSTITTAFIAAQIAARNATTTGGGFNIVSGDGNAVSGARGFTTGNANTDSGFDTIVSGANNNNASTASLVGGQNNTLDVASARTLMMGTTNTVATGTGNIISGSQNDLADQTDSFVQGFSNDLTNGLGARNFVMGFQNVVSVPASDSVLMGISGNMAHTNSFLFSSASGATTTNASSFTAHLQGSARFISNFAGTTGVVLAPGASAWAAVSGRDKKTDIKPFRNALDKIERLGVYSYSYKDGEGKAVRRVISEDKKGKKKFGEPLIQLGPMADGLDGWDEVIGSGIKGTVSAHDMSAFSLSAIKELLKRVKTLEAKVAVLESE